MLNYTLDEFLEKNRELKLFKSDSLATDFYQLIAVRNIQPAVLILAEILEAGMGYNNINTIVGNNTYDELGVTFKNSLFNARLDDLIVTLDLIPGLTNEYGNYLVSDLLDLIGEKPVLKNTNTVLLKMTYSAASRKDKFLDIVAKDVNQNVGSDDYNYYTRLIHYYTFFSRIVDSPRSSLVKNLVLNEYTRVEEKIIGLLKYAKSQINMEGNLITKLNLLSIHSVQAYNRWMDTLQSTTYLSTIASLIDLYPRLA